jgi:hypothetical protein
VSLRKLLDDTAECRSEITGSYPIDKFIEEVRLELIFFMDSLFTFWK